jgi:hypothetical protein
MSNYYWSEFFGRPPAERYPDWVEGVGMWREFIGGDDFARQRLLDALVSVRASVPWGAAGTELSRPRLFVSHRKDDEARALDVATLAQAEGFQVWLDVLDSALQSTARASTGAPADALAVALIIEMALLNSTHVVALITPRTPGTYWVPYEYGRMKDSSPHSLRAACWIDQHVTYEPEYLELGVKTRSDDDIRDWLRGEIAKWNRVFASSTSGRQISPTSARPLSPDELEAIAKPFREGLGIDIQAPARAAFRPKTPNRIPSDDGPTLLVTERDITVKGIRLKRRDA